jgi:hypothetical protein
MIDSWLLENIHLKKKEDHDNRGLFPPRHIRNEHGRSDAT